MGWVSQEKCQMKVLGGALHQIQTSVWVGGLGGKELKSI